jgi:glycosyltransferase involved in cell wall biosynthesis
VKGAVKGRGGVRRQPRESKTARRRLILPLRIALVGPLPPPFGGMANQTQQLAELLRGEGVSVGLIQTNADYRPRWVARVPLLRALLRLLPYLLALWRGAGTCQLMHVMANSGWSWHLFAAPAIWIARLRGTPVIVHYHGGEAESFIAGAEKSVRFTLRQASALIVPSGFLKAVFAGFGLSASIVPNVVDLRRFKNAGPHRTVRRRFLVARNLEPIYDNETAIRAFSLVHRSYPDATLTIAGCGPLAQSLRALADGLGLAGAVVFTGRLDPDAMAEIYRQADIAINPSLVDNLPGSVLEALASGIPVVSTKVGGVPFVVTDRKTALLVPARSPEAMAAAMLSLIDDPALSGKLIANGLAQVQNYTWRRVWPVLADIYQEARQSGASPA